MQRIELRQLNRSAGNPAALAAIAATWFLVILGAIVWMIVDNDFTNPIQDAFLIPWVFGCGIIVSAPSVYLLYKGKFDLFHPLVFAAWAYTMPCLVGGGLIIALGLSDFYFLSFIDDQDYNLPLTLVYVAIGYIGLVAGFALPAGAFMGRGVEARLPKWQWSLGHTWIAGYLLVIAGTLVNIIGFINGLLGFQRFDNVETFDGMIFFLLIMFFQGYFLLWYALFKTPNKDSSYLITLTLLVLLVPLRMAIMGNRGSIYLCLLPIAFAYIVSGKKVSLKHGAIFGSLLFVAVFVGMIYGSTFRMIKGSDTRLGAGDYVGQIGATLDFLAEKDTTYIVNEATKSLTDRLENLSSLAVIVSNYEKLAPYEESYGLSNNIVNDALTAFIPRFLWNDKPLTSDAHAYSDLYFDYGNNSFAVTPWGDLLRNYGPFGIPIGMALLGIFLRVLYTALGTPIDGGQWRSAAYYVLLTTVSYEAFYATIFPSLVRAGVVLAVTLYLCNLISARANPNWRLIK